MSRLQLLVEVLQRAYRMLTEEDQGHYAAAFARIYRGMPGSTSTTSRDRILASIYRRLVN